MVTGTEQETPYFLEGGGAMGALVRSHDWSHTPLGAAAGWPQSLRTAVSLMLHSRFPMFLFWGPGLLSFYNDAFRSSLGHHATAGLRAADVWGGSWPDLQPQIEHVRLTGEASFEEDGVLLLFREGRVQETHWTYSLSPVRDEGGAVAGVLMTGTETTAQTHSLRRLEQSERLLRTFILQAPTAMAIFKGSDYVVDIANDCALELWGRRLEEVAGRPILDAMPELKDQGIQQLLNGVYQTGTPFSADELPVQIRRKGTLETRYVNFTYAAVYGEDGHPNGIMAVGVDVTDQVRARMVSEASVTDLNLNRQRLEQSEAQLRSIIAGAPAAIGVFMGRDLIVRNTNQLFIDIVGKGPDIEGKPLREVLPELLSNNEPFFQILDDVFTSGKPFQSLGTQVNLLQNGVMTHNYYNITFTPLFDANGQVYAILDVSVDVTEQIMHRNKIEEEKERANLAVDVAGLGVFEVDLETNVVTSDRRFYELFGYDRPVSRAEYVSAIHPDDRFLREAANRQVLEKGWFDYECRIAHAGRRLRWLRLKGKLLRNEKGESTKMLGVVQDITEVKEFASALAQQVHERTQALEAAQQALIDANSYQQHILDNFDTAFISLEPIYDEKSVITDFRFRKSNVAYSAYTGLPPAAIEGRPVSELFPGYYATDSFAHYRDAFEKGGEDNWELHYDRDGLNVFLQVGLTRNDGELWAHFIDISHLKNLQIELERKVEELERSNQNLEEFAYAASHDLKEPIRKIHYFGDRLRLSLGNNASPDQRLVLDRMDVAAKRMGSLIDNLLSYSQVSLRSRLLESVDLDKLIAVVLDDLDLQVEEKKAAIEKDSLPVIMGHTRQLQQAFHNLIGNALKYSRAGVPPVIRITCHRRAGQDTGLNLSPMEQQREYYCITVADNGIGFEQENAERIFNIFTRLHTNAEYSGTGIGLSIVRKVIENYGGFIRAFGEPGQGSRFEIFFPVVSVMG